MPRKKVRRGRLFLVMNIGSSCPAKAGHYIRRKPTPYQCDATNAVFCAVFIWNGTLFTIPRTIDENR